MKKGLIFAGTVFVLIAAGFIYSITTVWGQREQVELRHTTVAGDMSAADGISFALKNQWSDRLFWDTKVTIDENMVQASKDGEAHEIESITKFHTDWAYKGTQSYRHLMLDPQEAVAMFYTNGGEHWSTSLDDGISMTEFMDNYRVDFKQLIIDVAYKTDPGEQYSETILLADYMEYYPISMEIYVQLVDSAWGIYKEGAGDYLGIKVPRDHRIQVSVRKNEDDKLVEYRTESISGGLSFEPCSVSVGETVYFAFYGKNEMGIPTDLETKIGNGIYRIDTSVTDSGYGGMSPEADINYEEMKVFSLPEKDCYPMELQTDEDGNILLFTKEAGKLVLRVIEPETMQELQKLELIDDMEHVEYRQAYIYENYILVMQENGALSFITKEAEGYKVLVTGTLGNLNSLSSSYEWNYAMDYKDGRLALIFTEDYYLCSAYVYVFSSEGLEYQGYFEYSADTVEDGSFYDRISPVQGEGLAISF